MGLVDRVKQNLSDTVDLAKDGLGEVKELKERREVTHLYGDLGKKVYALIEKGELSHPSLEADLKEIRRTLADREYIKGTGSSTAAGSPGAPTRDDI
jgi:hypothetical protein